MNAVSTVTLGGRSFRVEALNLPAPHKDQDAWLVCDDFVAVADGATPLRDERPSVVQEFARAALTELKARRGDSPQRMVRMAIQTTRRLADQYSPPLSCTLAVARTAPEGIQIVVLGDCTAVVADDQGRRRTIRDHRLGRVDRGPIARLAELTQAGISVEDADRAIAADLIANRLRMNSPDWYWSFSADSAASRHVLRRAVSPESVSALLLCSDGFARLADTFAASGGMTGLLRRCQREGLASLGEELRSLEEEPESLTRYPRFGRHDDATAILLTARNAQDTTTN